MSDKKRKSGGKTSNQWDPDAPEGVNYFKQFAKAFMPPYGKVMGVLPDHEVLNKHYAYTCEWLTRPTYGISEMADTIYANLSSILKDEDKVFTRGTCRYLATNLEPLKPQLRRFNNKDREIVHPPDLNDLATVMKAMEADDSFKRLVREYFATSGSMFLVMTHIIVLQVLLWHPVDFERKACETHAVQRLKSHPTRANLRDYLVSEILSHATAPSHKRRGTDVQSVWDEGYQQQDDDTDDDSRHDDDEPNIWDTSAAGPSGESHAPSSPVTPRKKTTSSTQAAKKTSPKKATKENTKQNQKSATSGTTTSPAWQADHGPFGDPFNAIWTELRKADYTEPELSQERELFVTQQDPARRTEEPFIETTLTAAEKGKGPKKGTKDKETTTTTANEQTTNTASKRKTDDPQSTDKQPKKKHKKSKKE